MLLKNSVIYIIAKAIPALAAFFALSLYTHLLSPEEYGVYTLVFTAAIFTHNSIFNWINMATMRFWSSKHYNTATFVSSIGIAYFRVLAFSLVPLIIALYFYWGQPMGTWILSGFILTLTLALFSITQTLLSAQIKPEKYAMLTIITSVSTLSLGALLAYLGYGAIGIIIGLSLGFLTPSLLASFSTWKTFNKSAYDPVLFKRLLTYGLPLASAAILEEFTKSTDRFMLAGLQDTAQAGMYSVGYDLSGNAIFMIMSAINLAAYPVIIKLLETDGKQVAFEYFEKYTVLLLALSIPTVIGLSIVGSNLVYLMIGSAYQETVILLLPWISTALLLLGLQVFYFDLAFQLGHYTIGIVKIGIFIALANVGLNYWLIPLMGIQGAAIATISSFAFGSVLSLIFGRKYFTLPFPLHDFIKIVIASIGMGAVLWTIKDAEGWGGLVLQLLIGMSSYAAFILMLNVMALRNHVVDYLTASKSPKSITSLPNNP
ncbi:MAG: oligosaccharide flippase family protein [Cocleimonas sp.]|nr:oligosaccharide flippase family protein [Cocleimonas sp.]